MMKENTKCRVKRATTMTDHCLRVDTKRYIDPQLEFIGRIRTGMTPKQEKKLLKGEKSTRLTADTVVQNIQFLLNYLYKNKEDPFYIRMTNFLKDCSSFKTKIYDRLCKIEYLEPTLKHKAFLNIELEILQEWKKNYLLVAMVTYWFKFLKRTKFQKIGQFMAEYELFRDMVSQTSYMLFKECFEVLEKKQVAVLDKLFHETAHSIITGSSEWAPFAKSTFVPLMAEEEEPQNTNYEFDLASLNPQIYTFDLDSREPQFQATIAEIKKLDGQFKLKKLIQTFRSIRAKLEQELLARQNSLIESKQLNKFVVVQKDDIINCIIYCIIVGEVKGISTSLLYIKTLMGEQIHDTLSKWGVDSYRADLESAIQFLEENNLSSKLVTQPKTRENTLSSSVS